MRSLQTIVFTILIAIALLAPIAFSDPASDSAKSRIPLRSVEIDIPHKQIRIACESLNPQMPVEFFCVVTGGQEYESVLRTPAQPSKIHFALLTLGLTPGTPAHFDEHTNTWYPPTGDELKISCEFRSHGKLITVPANRLLRSVKTKKEMPAFSWVFDGSRMLPDGRYAADICGYVVSIVNFDLTMIDVPELASNANETLEWEFNPDVCPPAGAPITMIIEPLGQRATTRPHEGTPAGQFNPGPGMRGGG